MAAGRAARAAAWISGNVLGDWAVQRGWFARAQTFLEEAGGNGPELGWVLILRSLSEPDPQVREGRLREAIAVGRRFGDPDLEYEALGHLGGLFVMTDRIEEGLVLLDEALAAACAGEMSEVTTVDKLFCGFFWACELVNDVPSKREARFAGTAVPNFFRRPYGPGWALVGDAGYNKDFITAQGMLDAFRDAELCATAPDQSFSGARPYDDAMADYQSTRDEHVLPMFEFTCQLATLEPPPPRAPASARGRTRQPGRNGWIRTRERRCDLTGRVLRRRECAPYPRRSGTRVDHVSRQRLITRTRSRVTPPGSALWGSAKPLGEAQSPARIPELQAELALGLCVRGTPHLGHHDRRRLTGHQPPQP